LKINILVVENYNIPIADQKNVISYRNQLFEDLKKYYDSNYEDVDIRMGNLVLMLCNLKVYLLFQTLGNPFRNF
jgi:hypothetical protein